MILDKGPTTCHTINMYPSLTILSFMLFWMSLGWMINRLRGKPTGDARLRAKYDARQERLIQERRWIADRARNPSRAVLHADGKNWL
jgi:hypothetical protein